MPNKSWGEPCNGTLANIWDRDCQKKIIHNLLIPSKSIYYSDRFLIICKAGFILCSYVRLFSAYRRNQPAGPFRDNRSLPIVEARTSDVILGWLMITSTLSTALSSPRTIQMEPLDSYINSCTPLHNNYSGITIFNSVCLVFAQQNWSWNACACQIYPQIVIT